MLDPGPGPACHAKYPCKKAVPKAIPCRRRLFVLRELLNQHIVVRLQPVLDACSDDVRPVLDNLVKT